MTKHLSANNLFQMLTISAQKFSERTAMFFANQKISYKQLYNMSDRLSQGLKNLGIKNSDRVALLLHNCPEFVVAYFAILKREAICVTINNMLKGQEIEYILRDSQAQTLITSIVYLEQLNSLKEKDSLLLKNIILIDAVMPGTLNFYEIIEHSFIDKEIAKPAQDDNIATILYTSGTTGDPKGAMLTHKNLISNINSCLLSINASHRDNFICLLPMFHSFALTVCILMPLSVGAGITIIEHLRPFRRIIRNVIKKNVTIFVAIPSIFNVLSHMHIPPIFTSRVLKLIDPLRLCISGAAALSVEVLKEFEHKFKVPLLEGYGLTEASPVVSLNPMRKERKPGSVGLPIDEVKVKVVDSQGNDLPEGQEGELLIKGPNVMKGYFNNLKASADTIIEGWLYSGDIARIDAQGYIYIVDRKKDMINVRGLNVYPAEIEKVLLKHPAIKEAAVIGVSDRFKGEVPKAFIILREGGAISEKETIDYLRKNLALFKIPKFVEFRDALPKTATGKIMKQRLKGS